MFDYIEINSLPAEIFESILIELEFETIQLICSERTEGKSWGFWAEKALKDFAIPKWYFDLALPRGMCGQDRFAEIVGRFHFLPSLYEDGGSRSARHDIFTLASQRNAKAVEKLIEMGKVSSNHHSYFRAQAGSKDESAIFLTKPLMELYVEGPTQWFYSSWGDEVIHNSPEGNARILACFQALEKNNIGLISLDLAKHPEDISFFAPRLINIQTPETLALVEQGIEILSRPENFFQLIKCVLASIKTGKFSLFERFYSLLKQISSTFVRSASSVNRIDDTIGYQLLGSALYFLQVEIAEFLFEQIDFSDMIASLASILVHGLRSHSKPVSSYLLVKKLLPLVETSLQPSMVKSFYTDVCSIGDRDLLDLLFDKFEQVEDLAYFTGDLNCLQYLKEKGKISHKAISKFLECNSCPQMEKILTN